MLTWLLCLMKCSTHKEHNLLIRKLFLSDLSTGLPIIDVSSVQSLGKRKVILQSDTVEADCSVSYDIEDSSKKQKKQLSVDVTSLSKNEILGPDEKSRRRSSATDEPDTQRTTNFSRSESIDCVSDKFISSVGAPSDKFEDDFTNRSKDTNKEPEFHQSSFKERHEHEGFSSRSEWKPIEKELYLKGVEIFGRNRYTLLPVSILMFDITIITCLWLLKIKERSLSISL